MQNVINIISIISGIITIIGGIVQIKIYFTSQRHEKIQHTNYSKINDINHNVRNAQKINVVLSGFFQKSWKRGCLSSAILSMFQLSAVIALVTSISILILSTSTNRLLHIFIIFISLSYIYLSSKAYMSAAATGKQKN